jgi:hypothetical protein
LNSLEHQAFRAAVEEKYRVHVQAFKDEVTEPIVTRFFAPDAVCECAGFPRHEGTEQLRTLFDEVTKAGHDVAFRPIRSYVDGAVGWDFVDYPVRPRDPDANPFMFRCIFCWVRRADDWKVSACVGFTVPYAP